MKPLQARSSLRNWALAAAILGAGPLVQAHPYASGVTNEAGTIRFILNESADNVGVSFDNGVATNNLGALAQGPNSFSLGAHTNYAIYVFKVGAGGPVQISVDASNTVRFPAPRGIAVNANPRDHHFGLVYAANSSPGNTGLATKGRGLYVLKADTSDAFGRGTNASAALFTSASANSPYRIGLGPDNAVYVGDFSTAAATVWAFDPDLNSFTNQILGIVGETAGIAAGYHGDISSAPCVKGSLATGDLVLYTADGGLGPLYNSIKQYVIGAGPVPWSNAPNQLGCIGLCGIAELNTDLALAKDGRLFANINRVNHAAPNLTVFDTDGVTVLWDSISAAGGALGAGPDLVQDARSVRVSPDDHYVALLHTDNHISVLRLTNGIPDASTLFVIANTPSTTIGRAIAWDAADNVYAVSSGQGLLRIYSLGQTTTAITSNDASGTNGMFQLLTPATQVSVTANPAFASQSGPTPGVFTLTRSSVNPGDLNQPLTVNFTLGGTATNGVYTVSPAGITPAANGTITFAAGQTSTNVTITPAVDGLSRPTTTVLLSLKGGGAYVATAPQSATITIENIGPQVVFISGVSAPSMYKRHTNDYASFVLTRWGDTNAASYTVSSFTYAGTAALGTDFVGAGPITLNPGDVTATNTISPLAPTTNYAGNRTVVIGLTNGNGYSAASGTATLTIIDSANPPAPLLYSDPLSDPNDALHWNITFGNGDSANAPADYNVDFGYDLTTDPTGTHGIIPPPPNGATTALRVTCNKLFNPGAAAGVNVYYTNQACGGDYAVRFNLNLIEGGNPSYSTEGVLFGINHTGSQSNWWYGSGPLVGGPWASDGIWYYVTSDPGGGGAGDYLEFTGAGGSLPNTGWQQLGSQSWTTFANAFKVPAVYTTVEGNNGGVPANGTPLNGHDASTWSDVEIKQVRNVVTLSIDKTPIFVYTNTTSFTNGYVMLGYADPYGGSGGVSVGAPDAAAYFSNLRVVRLAGPTITSIALNNQTNVVIDLTSVDGDDTVASFALQSAGANKVTGPYSDVSGATFTQLSNGAFQTSVISTNAAQYYRIRHK